MKTYPVLYKKDSLNNIRIWRMEQDGGKYRTVSGLQNGQQVISDWLFTIEKNKEKANATDVTRQAELEVAAKYKKQMSQGGYWENIQDIDKVTYFTPMLAHGYLNYKNDIDWSLGNYVSPKMDGLRCIIDENGSKSRNGKSFTSFPHILRELQPILNEFPGIILDGEIYCDKLNDNFDKIISLAKKSKFTQEDLDESEKYLQFWIFDCPIQEGGFHRRYLFLQNLIQTKFKNNKWIKLCPHTLVIEPKEIELCLHEYLEEGFEGLMLNTYNGEYQGKRSKNLLKYKNFIDKEFEIVEISEGQGNRSGMFGFATLKLLDGRTFDSNARGGEEFYRELLKNKNNYIGQLATVRYQNLTPDGIPRFPVIIGIRDYE